MPTWLWIVIVVVGVLAAGAFRERWRLTGMEKWSKTHGFVVHAPFVPGDRPPMAALVARFNPHGARRWGAGAGGSVDGLEVTIGEHESTEPGRKSGVWHTLVAWPTRESAGPIVLWPKARGPVDEALAAVAGGGSDMRLAERLGIRDRDPVPFRTITEGGMLVEGDPLMREAWLTESRRQALEAWPHGGAFVIDGGYAAWRTSGLLTPARLEDVLGQVREARRLLE